MAKIRKFDERFVQMNYDELWLYDDTPDNIVCLSDRDTVIILGVLQVLHWGTRWVGNVDRALDHWPLNLLREQGRLADLKTATDYITNLEARLMSTSCADAMLAGLTLLANAVKSISIVQNCGSGCSGSTSGYMQGITTNGSIRYGSEQPNPGPANQGEVPPGWEGTYAEWLVHKCQASNAIADGIIQSLNNLIKLDIAALITTGVGAAVIFGFIAPTIVVPPVAISILISTLVTLGVLLPELGRMAGYFQSHRSEIVCSLYNSGTASIAIDNFESWVDEAIGALGIATIANPLVRTVCLLLASTDTMNQLFKTGLAVAYPDADCSGCNTELFMENYGQPYNADGNMEYLGNNSFRWVSGSANFNGGWYFNFRALDGEDNPVYFKFTEFTLTNFGLTNVGELGGSFDGAVYPAFDAYSVQDIIDKLLAADWVDYFYLNSSQSFTFECTIVKVSNPT